MVRTESGLGLLPWLCPMLETGSTLPLSLLLGSTCGLLSLDWRLSIAWVCLSMTELALALPAYGQVMLKVTTQCAVALVVSESAATMLSGMPSSTLLPPQVWHL